MIERVYIDNYKCRRRFGGSDRPSGLVPFVHPDHPRAIELRTLDVVPSSR